MCIERQYPDRGDRLRSDGGRENVQIDCYKNPDTRAGYAGGETVPQQRYLGVELQVVLNEIMEQAEATYMESFEEVVSVPSAKVNIHFLTQRWFILLRPNTQNPLDSIFLNATP